ncbi:mitochondrial nicotinamide adenine dinucleotide transporter SLC25A51-like [Antedon mediterranea]|uniref:mitochondrial nicotinamide adenine dinucleotide transporter SLC25A51-like n=1 Tax=Antedon mediterranea TaxID=105859 RepID=UPI003AF5B441
MTNKNMSLHQDSGGLLNNAKTAEMQVQPTSETISPEPVHESLEFFYGGGAAFINIMVTFPLNKVLFRQQLHGIGVERAFAQLQREGPAMIFRGVLPPLLQKTTSTALMFGLYDQYSKMIRHQFPSIPVSSAKMLAAVFSGTSEAILVPFERVQTVLQDNRQKHYRNTIHVFKELYSKYGIKELYRGLTPILLRNGPSNAVFFGFRHELKDLLPEAQTQTGNILNDFVSGAVLGASISTVWYPINVVKTRMMVKVGGEYLSFRQTFWNIYYERGKRLYSLFYGVHLNFSRALISWGIINASYELLKQTFTPR